MRRATAADSAALAGLRMRAQAEDGGHGEPDHDAFVEFFAAWFTAHSSTHLPFVAEVAGEVVGMAWLMIAERVPAPAQPLRRFGDVQSVYVLPEVRGRGIATALLVDLLATARTLGLEHVTVHSSDRAVRVYQRAGFGPDEHWLRWVPQ